MDLRPTVVSLFCVLVGLFLKVTHCYGVSEYDCGLLGLVSMYDGWAICIVDVVLRL